MLAFREAGAVLLPGLLSEDEMPIDAAIFAYDPLYCEVCKGRGCSNPGTRPMVAVYDDQPVTYIQSLPAPALWRGPATTLKGISSGPMRASFSAPILCTGI
jgi:hypothetical protein